jgi:hypothetical protein
MDPSSIYVYIDIYAYISLGNPEGKRLLGRPRRRWVDNIFNRPRLVAPKEKIDTSRYKTGYSSIKEEGYFIYTLWTTPMVYRCIYMYSEK